MRNYAIITILLILTAFTQSCKKKEVVANFEDMDQLTIYNYIVDSSDKYSSFLQILEHAGIDKTLSAYNPDANGYTLFLPDNKAIDEFISQNARFSSLQDMFKDTAYTTALAKYHVVNQALITDNFPFGALPALTLSGDQLTVGFVSEPDTSYYNINNQAPVIKPNIEVSNGIIHLISKVLTPITYTSYEWLSNHSEYSIFKAAVDATGFENVIDLNIKNEENTANPFTLVMEADSVFKKVGINSLDDLIARVSPDDHNFNDPTNPLYNFVGYHMLKGVYYLDNFVDNATNYSTYSDIPLNINGTGLDIYINKGKQTFDTIIQNGDTTKIDYILFAYDESNVNTQSGVIHFINRVMQQQQPSRAQQTYEFGREPMFQEFSQTPASYLVEDSTGLNYIHYSGTDLFYVKEADGATNAWSTDYLLMDGDFSISYTIPEIVQGNYTVSINADAFNTSNAVIEVYVDGNKVGGLVDLTSGGSADNPFLEIELGDVDFIKYSKHTVEVRSLIPGRFLWDFIRFEPK
ncbi:MAG TPA: fasciclin domain-containing protein [Bacteroidales bacterium]|nr:fasciclin domain-containing protein [Bacteroidales bacterium]